MTSKVPRKHTNPTPSLPFLALSFPRISGFNCQGDHLAQQGEWLGNSLICSREKTGDFCLTDTHLNCNRRNLWGGPGSTSPLHMSHVHPKTSRSHALRLSLPVCIPSKFHPVIFTASLSSRQVIALPCWVTRLGLWLWSIPAGHVLSDGYVTGYMWQCSLLYWRDGQIKLDKIQRAIQSHSEVRECLVRNERTLGAAEKAPCPLLVGAE